MGTLARAESERPRRLGWKPHEIALVGMGFVQPLAGSTQPEFLGSDALKIAALGVTLLLLFCHRVWTLGRDRPRMAPYMAGPVLALLTAYGVSSVLADITSDRWALFAFMIVAALGWWIVERDRAGSWLRIVYTVSVLHLAYAAIANIRTTQFGTGERLAGGTSPVLLGFEAACVIIVSLLMVSRGARKVPRLLIVALAVYVMFAAFSRASLISLVAALVLVFIFWTRRHVALRFFFGAVAFVLLVGPVTDTALNYLSGGNVEGFLGATGRYNLWGLALANFDGWATGFGFFPLRGQTAGEETLRIALNGLPVENSAIQALFTAGVVGFAIWASLFIRAIFGLLHFRHESRGLVIALAAPLVVAAIYSVGLAAGSFDWWWLLGALSVVNGLSAPSTTQPTAIPSRRALARPRY